MRYQYTLFVTLALALAACEKDDPAAPAANSGGGQPYEVAHDVINASGWFGGDNRPAFAPRSVGVGCSVLIEEDIVLESFSFSFTKQFDYHTNPDNTGHIVTLPLSIRDESGNVLKTVTGDLPAAYAGGWVTWTGIDLDVDAQTTLVFTTYLVGAYDVNEYYNGHESDANAGYANGTRFVKEATSDAEMEEWADWNPHPWDAAFVVQGTTR